MLSGNGYEQFITEAAEYKLLINIKIQYFYCGVYTALELKGEKYIKYLQKNWCRPPTLHSLTPFSFQV